MCDKIKWNKKRGAGALPMLGVFCPAGAYLAHCLTRRPNTHIHRSSLLSICHGWEKPWAHVPTRWFDFCNIRALYRTFSLILFEQQHRAPKQILSIFFLFEKPIDISIFGVLHLVLFDGRPVVTGQCSTTRPNEISIWLLYQSIILFAPSNIYKSNRSQQ